MGLNVLNSQDGRLLHHIAQVTGKCKLRAFTLRERGLDKQYLAANRCPGQTSYHAGIIVALIDVAIERWLAKQSLQLAGGNLLVLGTILNLSLKGYLTQGLVNLLLKLANTALTGVSLNNHLDGSLIKGWLHTLYIQTGVIQLAWYQVPLCYFNLFLCDIATYIDNLHTVE